MKLTLIVGDINKFSALKEIFLSDGHKVLDAPSIKAAEKILSELSIDLMVVDEKIGEDDGLSFLKDIVTKNPFLNTALVSSLGKNDFHEFTEGLGIIMQLTSPPSSEESRSLLEKANEIFMITGQSRGVK